MGVKGDGNLTISYYDDSWRSTESQNSWYYTAWAESGDTLYFTVTSENGMIMQLNDITVSVLPMTEFTMKYIQP